MQKAKLSSQSYLLPSQVLCFPRKWQSRCKRRSLATLHSTLSSRTHLSSIA